MSPGADPHSLSLVYIRGGGVRYNVVICVIFLFYFDLIKSTSPSLTNKLRVKVKERLNVCYRNAGYLNNKQKQATIVCLSEEMLINTRSTYFCGFISFLI